MPYKKKYRKRRRRRRQPGKAKRRYAQSLVLRAPSVVPDQMYLKMKYRGNITLSDAQGSFTVHNFRANSIFDPDQTGTGGQPLGRDQWQAFYGRYQVMGCKAHVELMPTDNQGGNANVALVAADGVGVILSIEEAQEQPYAVSKMLPSASTKQTTLTSYVSTKAKFGYTNSILNEGNLQSTMGTNPVEQWYFVIAAQNYIGQMEINANVELTYYVRLFDRKELARS